MSQPPSVTATPGAAQLGMGRGAAGPRHARRRRRPWPGGGGGQCRCAYCIRACCCRLQPPQALEAAKELRRRGQARTECYGGPPVGQRAHAGAARGRIRQRDPQRRCGRQEGHEGDVRAGAGAAAAVVEPRRSGAAAAGRAPAAARCRRCPRRAPSPALAWMCRRLLPRRCCLSGCSPFSFRRLRGLQQSRAERLNILQPISSCFCCC